MKLLIVCPILYRDLDCFRSSLLSSIKNLQNVFGGSCCVHLVIQHECVAGIVDAERAYFSCLDNMYIDVTDRLNTSSARNVGIQKSRDHGFSHILFHDISLYYPISSIEFFFKNIGSRYTPKIKMIFSSEYFEPEVQESVVIDEVNPIYNSYVGMYLFRVEYIQVLFDETIGPGSNTVFKSGEDVLFLFNYFKNIPLKHVLFSSTSLVFHPPRPKDNSKQLLYASGQGYMFRTLLSEHFSLVVLFDLFLFLSNAVFRVLIFKKSALIILRLRIKGLLGVQ